MLAHLPHVGLLVPDASHCRDDKARVGQAKEHVHPCARTVRDRHVSILSLMNSFQIKAIVSVYLPVVS